MFEYCIWFLALNNCVYQFKVFEVHLKMLVKDNNHKKNLEQRLYKWKEKPLIPKYQLHKIVHVLWEIKNSYRKIYFRKQHINKIYLTFRQLCPDLIPNKKKMKYKCKRIQVQALPLIQTRIIRLMKRGTEFDFECVKLRRFWGRRNREIRRK